MQRHFSRWFGLTSLEQTADTERLLQEQKPWFTLLREFHSSIKGSTDDLSLRVYVQQQFDKGLSPSSTGINAFVEVSGQSSLTGEISDDGTKSVWEFSTTVLPTYPYNSKKYCFRWVIVSREFTDPLYTEIRPSPYPKFTVLPLVMLPLRYPSIFTSR